MAVDLQSMAIDGRLVNARTATKILLFCDFTESQNNLLLFFVLDKNRTQNMKKESNAKRNSVFYAFCVTFFSNSKRKKIQSRHVYALQWSEDGESQNETTLSIRKPCAHSSLK